MNKREISKRRSTWTSNRDFHKPSPKIDFDKPCPKRRKIRIPSKVSEHGFMKMICSPLSKLTGDTKDAIDILIRDYIFILKASRLAELMDRIPTQNNIDSGWQIECSLDYLLECPINPFIRDIGGPLKNLLFDNNYEPYMAKRGLHAVYYSHIHSMENEREKKFYNEIPPPPLSIPVIAVQPYNQKNFIDNQNLKPQSINTKKIDHKIPSNLINDGFIRYIYIPLLDLAGDDTTHEIKRALKLLLRQYLFYVDITKTIGSLDPNNLIISTDDKNWDRYQEMELKPDTFLSNVFYPLEKLVTKETDLDVRMAIRIVLDSYFNSIDQVKNLPRNQIFSKPVKNIPQQLVKPYNYEDDIIGDKELPVDRLERIT